MASCSTTNRTSTRTTEASSASPPLFTCESRSGADTPGGLCPGCGGADRVVPRRGAEAELGAEFRVVDDVGLFPLVRHLGELAHHGLEDADAAEEPARDLHRFDRAVEGARDSIDQRARRFCGVDR